MNIEKKAIAVVAITLLGIVVCLSDGNAQTVIASKGAWQISAPVDADKSPDKSSLSTFALDQAGGKFSLSCGKDAPLYYFAFGNEDPSSSRADEEPRFSIRVDDQEPVWFQTVWRQARIEVRERVHQTAFSIIMNLLTATGASTVELSAGNNKWTFALEGFADLRSVLRERCGYDFGQERAPPTVPARRGR